MVVIPSRDWDNRAISDKGLADIGGTEHVLLSAYSPDPSWAVTDTHVAGLGIAISS